MLRRYYTRGDIVLTVFCVLVSLASIAWVQVWSDSGKHVVVDVDGRHVLELSLGTNVTTTVTRPLGDTVVSVANGAVSITESPCPHGYCKHMGPISHRGEIIVCAPNHVMITISGGSDTDAYDGVTQ